jgi:hypothetical protein
MTTSELQQRGIRRDTSARSGRAKKYIMSRVADVLRKERATATNIESAVDKAGVDRDEVIATFGSMHCLILEMVSDLSEELIQPLESHPMDRTVRDVLIEFGNRLAITYSGSHLIALYRITLSEATRHSGIGRDFFERGPGKLAVCLARYLESSARPHDQSQIPDATRVADNFLSLLGDALEFSDWMSVMRTAAARDHRDAVVEAVDLFCHGIIKGGL